MFQSPNLKYAINNDHALAEANTVLALKGSSFNWARYLLGKTHANRATRLYRFCRYIDDLADEATSVLDAKHALQLLSLDIATGHARNSITQDALLLIKECNISPEIIQALIDGVMSDLEPVAMQNMNDLLRYCYRVAGTVGLMMCKVLDINDEKAYPFAIDLGIGMQLTNICRDIADDAKLGRRYLPASLIGDIEASDLVIPSKNMQANLQHCVKNLLAIANSYYKSGESGLPYIPTNARFGMAVAAKVYSEIGVVLAQQDYQYWLGRAVVSRQSKFNITFLRLLNACISPKFWRLPQAHHAQLHQALTGLPMTNTQLVTASTYLANG